MAPHVARAQGLGTYGPLTRTVADAALALEVLSGEPGLVTAITASQRPLRIGMSLRTPVPSTSSRGAAAVATIASLLRRLGHEVVAVDVPFTPLLVVSFFARYLRAMADEFQALAHPDATEARTRALARVGRAIPRSVVAWAHARGSRETTRFAASFENLDVLLTPMLSRAPPRSSEWFYAGLVRTLFGVASYSPYAATWNVTGQPACAVPIGLDSEGLPDAVQFVGRCGAEAQLLGLAASIETVRPFPRLPSEPLAA